MLIVCPQEGKDDSIQRLPALVSGGTSSGSFSGPSSSVAYIDGKYGYSSGTTTLYGSLTSDIAHTLAQPAPPKEIRFWSLYGWSFLFYISLCIIIGPFLVWPKFKQSIVSDINYQKVVFTPEVSFLCILTLLFCWIPQFCLFLFLTKRMLIKRLDYPRRFKQWNQACKVWEQLYYCHRCGIVFDPITNAQFHPNQISQYLHISEYQL